MLKKNTRDPTRLVFSVLRNKRCPNVSPDLSSLQLDLRLYAFKEDMSIYHSYSGCLWKSWRKTPKITENPKIYLRVQNCIKIPKCIDSNKNKIPRSSTAVTWPIPLPHCARIAPGIRGLLDDIHCLLNAEEVPGLQLFHGSKIAEPCGFNPWNP